MEARDPEGTPLGFAAPALRFEAALRRDRRILIGTTVAVSGVGWAYLAGMRGQRHACHGGLSLEPWSLAEVLAAFGMWSAMTLAMMLPIVSPWALALAETTRRRAPGEGPLRVVGAFVSGYLTAWTGYSAAATAAQQALVAGALRSPLWSAASPWIGGALLVLAGLYQWTPLRTSCMRHCRSPMSFFLTSWQEGTRGAFAMGLTHGLFCIGCCWALMALCLAFGMMNLAWMAGLTVFVLLEKIGLFGTGFSRSAGACLAGGGLWMLSAAAGLAAPGF